MLKLYKTILLLFTATLLNTSNVTATELPEVTYTNQKVGFLEVSYHHTESEAGMDWTEANKTALAACMDWGFTGSIPFTGKRDSCISPTEAEVGSCNISLVKVFYQCVK